MHTKTAVAAMHEDINERNEIDRFAANGSAWCAQFGCISH